LVLSETTNGTEETFKLIDKMPPFKFKINNF
jgi:hypothetical protein